MGLEFSIFNFFITKTTLANNWRRKKNTFLQLFGFKMMPFFDSWPLIQNSKFNSFLWVCSDFVPPLENSTTRVAIFRKHKIKLSILLNSKSIKRSMNEILVCILHIRFLLSSEIIQIFSTRAYNE